MEEEANRTEITDTRKDVMVNDLMLVLKSAMAKVSSRDQMWCDILATSEKHIRRVIDDNIR